jgi:hypothetical protein
LPIYVPFTTLDLLDNIIIITHELFYLLLLF